MNTIYFLNQIMGNLFHTDEEPNLPTAYYLGLSSTEPNKSGGNVTEPYNKDTAYTRLLLSELSVPEEGVVKNTTRISFPKSTAAWGHMTHYVVFDAETDGNLLFYGQINGGISVEANATITIPVGGLVLTQSDLV